MEEYLTDLLRRLRECTQDPKWAFALRRDEPCCYVPTQPVSIAELDGAENRLGFSLPPLLRKIYSEVSNGNFGPGPHGLMDLATLVGTYLTLRDPNARAANKSVGRKVLASQLEPWPPELLPITKPGWGMFECVVRTQPGAPMFFCMLKPEDDRFRCIFQQRAASLQEWFEDWLSEARSWLIAQDSPPWNDEWDEETDTDIGVVTEPPDLLVNYLYTDEDYYYSVAGRI